MKTFIAFTGGFLAGWWLRDLAQAFKEADAAIGITDGAPIHDGGDVPPTDGMVPNGSLVKFGTFRNNEDIIFDMMGERE